MELDVRLTADGVPVVYHYFYLDGYTSGTGPVYGESLDDMRRLRVLGGDPAGAWPIPTLQEALEALAGRTTLEIELKGPELESAERVIDVLSDHRRQWSTMEITSFEPMLLREVRARCAIAVDLLTRRSEPWMKDDFVAYVGLQRARMAGARAVHLHPSQLSAEVVDGLRADGVDVHAWDVNEEAAFRSARALGIARITTDRAAEAVRWREKG